MSRSYSDFLSTFGCVTTITRTRTATGGCSDDAACNQTITYGTETEAPIITCLANTTIGSGESTNPSNTGEATDIDYCDPEREITSSDSTTRSAATRTWTASGDYGGASECMQTITITAGGGGGVGVLAVAVR